MTRIVSDPHPETAADLLRQEPGSAAVFVGDADDPPLAQMRKELFEDRAPRS